MPTAASEGRIARIIPGPATMRVARLIGPLSRGSPTLTNYEKTINPLSTVAIHPQQLFLTTVFVLAARSVFPL